MFLQRLWKYLLGKREEAKHLSYKDAVLAATIAELHGKKKGEKKAYISLEKLLCIHAIDRPSALQKIEERVSLLKKASFGEKISQKELAKVLPSISHFKVVPYKENYVTLEGNGRLLALKKVFSDKEIEVDVLDVSDDKKIEKVRKMYGLDIN